MPLSVSCHCHRRSYSPPHRSTSCDDCSWSPNAQVHLRQVSLDGCILLRQVDLAPLANCTALQSVNLAGLDYLTALNATDNPLVAWRQKPKQPPIASGKHCWPRLQRLQLNGCAHLSVIHPLGLGLHNNAHSALVHLELSFCMLLVDTSWLHGCSVLEHLNLSHCTALQSLQGVSHCAETLASIGLWGCSQLADIGPLAVCTKLQLLDCTDMVSDVTTDLHN